MTDLVYLLVGALLGTLYAYFHVRFEWKAAVRALQSFKEEQAAIVAAALSNSTLVDGVELPKPDDERWKQTDSFSVGQEKNTATLSIGCVYVTQAGIYVGTGKSVPVLPGTQAAQKYCADVWKAYRSRVARKAIETT